MEWILQKKNCSVCGEIIDEKVKDHCHLSGKYRGAAHRTCNLLYRVPKFIPVIMHNSAKYDTHLNCIAQNEEDYISFSKYVKVDTYTDKNGKERDVFIELRFIDSFKFMASNLDTLASYLPERSLKNLCSHYANYGSEKLELLRRKGVFPYDWFDQYSRLDETKLPTKGEFFSALKEAEISDEDYEHAQKVWKEFNCLTFRDYHDLYLGTDVLLLADVFEKFRNDCQKNYGLDPAWYYTLPGYAWDVLLKMTRVKLELLTDPNMLLMFENGIRGGISMASTRYGKANNPYMVNYKEREETKYIVDLDANNLYGAAMSDSLPVGGFKWMNKNELKRWQKLPCVLEVDLEYPKELHDLHNEYPLAPQNLVVNKVSKLIPNLYDKEKYIIHYSNLKQYLSLGMKLKKVHRGITFTEEP